MPDRCTDCSEQPTLHQPASYSETFAVRAPSGAALHLTLRLCLRCGSRFADRGQLREYLRTRLPDHALQLVGAAAR